MQLYTRLGRSVVLQLYTRLGRSVVLQLYTKLGRSVVLYTRLGRSVVLVIYQAGAECGVSYIPGWGGVLCCSYIPGWGGVLCCSYIPSLLSNCNTTLRPKYKRRRSLTWPTADPESFLSLDGLHNLAVNDSLCGVLPSPRV